MARAVSVMRCSVRFMPTESDSRQRAVLLVVASCFVVAVTSARVSAALYDWSAAAALGTWVQGIGVLAAIVFAGRQLQLTRQAAAQQAEATRDQIEASRTSATDDRRAKLFDDLRDVVHDELERTFVSWRKTLNAATAAHSIAESQRPWGPIDQDPYGEHGGWHHAAGEDAAARNEYAAADIEMRRVLDRVQRRARALSSEFEPNLERLNEFYTTIVPVFELADECENAKAVQTLGYEINAFVRHVERLSVRFAPGLS